jgi:hypothetical protein
VMMGLSTKSSRPRGSILFTGSPPAYRYLCKDAGSLALPSFGSRPRNLPVWGL